MVLDGSPREISGLKRNISANRAYPALFRGLKRPTQNKKSENRKKKLKWTPKSSLLSKGLKMLKNDRKMAEVDHDLAFGIRNKCWARGFWTWCQTVVSDLMPTIVSDLMPALVSDLVPSIVSVLVPDPCFGPNGITVLIKGSANKTPLTKMA